MMITALIMAAALTGGEPDGVITTAPATTVDLTAINRPAAPTAAGAAQQAAEPHNLTTDQQIDRWIAARDPEAVPYAGAHALEPEDDREVHGEFMAGIGTGGYRDYGASVSLPVGERGRVNLSFRQTENGYGRYGYPDYGYPYFDDSGYSFPGRYDPNAALRFEERVYRPGFLPNRPVQTSPNNRADD